MNNSEFLLYNKYLIHNGKKNLYTIYKMPRNTNYGRLRKRKGYGKKRKTNRQVARDQNIRKVCSQMLSRRNENKTLGSNPQYYGWTNTISDNSIPFNAINLASLYTIPTGEENGQRVGNKIYVKQADFCFNAQATNSNNVGPFIIDCWIGYVKPEQGFPPTSTQLLRLLDAGNTAVGQDGRTASLLRRVNTDLFTIVRHKRFKLGNAEHATTSQSNNDFPMFRNFRLPIRKLLGTMKFDDGSNPSKYMYAWFHATQVNSTIAVSTSLPEIAYYMDMKYTDN